MFWGMAEGSCWKKAMNDWCVCVWGGLLQHSSEFLCNSFLYLLGMVHKFCPFSQEIKKSPSHPLHICFRSCLSRHSVCVAWCHFVLRCHHSSPHPWHLHLLESAGPTLNLFSRHLPGLILQKTPWVMFSFCLFSCDGKTITR